MEEFTVSRILINLLIAMQWTIIFSLIAFVGGGIVGFIVTLMRISQNKWLRGISLVYVEFLQGTPLLLQLFLAFFGLSVVFGGELISVASGNPGSHRVYQRLFSRHLAWLN
jgi:polar amino acid transport system permease protein